MRKITKKPVTLFSDFSIKKESEKEVVSKKEKVRKKQRNIVCKRESKNEKG